MRPVVALLIVLLLTLPTAAKRKPYHRKIACKTPVNESQCYWTHGRLLAGNGTPAYRLWKVGTHRLLGIHSGPDAEKIDSLDNEAPSLPESLQRFRPDEEEAFADFFICPLEPEKPGGMQAACIEDAKHVVYRKYGASR